MERGRLRLAPEGCRAGIAAECHLVGTSSSADSDLFARERICTLEHEHCESVAQAYLQRGDKLAARDALERTCQSTSKEPEVPCLELGSAYLDAIYPEPVVGRGQALVDWSCGRLAARLEPAMMARFEQCKRAHPTAPAAQPK